jgi:uncharacterized repeat protein (TIGR03803 family)
VVEFFTLEFRIMPIVRAVPLALAAALGLSASSASAQVVRAGAGSPFTVVPLYSFSGAADGGSPQAALTVDSDGALYGTTISGGGANKGVVFKLTPPASGKSKWTETVLYSFSGADGANLMFTPALDSRGRLYGATLQGGANNLGVAFVLTPPVAPSTQWTETKIFDFTSSVGGGPGGAFVFDSSGALYGVGGNGGASGQGTIYKLTPPVPPATQWTGAALYNFSGGADGGYPGLTLIMDSSGALYGGTGYGGASGNGVVFKLTPPGGDCTPTAPNLWCESALYSFAGGVDGAAMVGGVTMDSHGALYGGTYAGGANGRGQIYKLTPPTPPSTQWTKTALYNFTGGVDGASPVSTPVLVGGALYGTNVHRGSCTNCGAIYQLEPPVPPSTQWTENTLWSFTSGADGEAPVAGLTFAPANFGLGVAIYGAASVGGTVFALQCAPRARLISGGALQTACAQ